MVVLLHGYPDTLQIWNRLAPDLAADFQVIAFDWPSMGQSEPWPGGETRSTKPNGSTCFSQNGKSKGQSSLASIWAVSLHSHLRRITRIVPLQSW
jgi:pimeloyl-ACP methyl ester carboxylesterase